MVQEQWHEPLLGDNQSNQDTHEEARSKMNGNAIVTSAGTSNQASTMEDKALPSGPDFPSNDVGSDPPVDVCQHLSHRNGELEHGNMIDTASLPQHGVAQDQPSLPINQVATKTQRESDASLDYVEAGTSKDLIMSNSDREMHPDKNRILTTENETTLPSSCHDDLDAIPRQQQNTDGSSKTNAEHVKPDSESSNVSDNHEMQDANLNFQDRISSRNEQNEPPHTQGDQARNIDASTEFQDDSPKTLIKDGLANMNAEFEVDTSPIESSSTDISADSSSSEESEEVDYEMLDPIEQARRLMQEDGGSDDDGGDKGTRGITSGPLRTLNEKPDEIIPRPNVIVTDGMKIEELGEVENLVENVILIRAKVTGEYEVLEYGSVLCLEDRTVIGAVAETLGRVQQPYYSVRFASSAAVAESGVSHGTKVFYVEQHSKSVFTHSLKTFKGSDASNLHDEEVADDEIEFSDDEAEAEHRKKVKLAKQNKREGRKGSDDRFSRGTRHGLNQRRKESIEKHDNPVVNYDDPENDDELYTPLTRPPNLHEIMGRTEAPLELNNIHARADRNSRGGRGRGDRDRGRGTLGGGDAVNSRVARGYRGNQDNRGPRGRLIINQINNRSEKLPQNKTFQSPPKANSRLFPNQPFPQSPIQGLHPYPHQSYPPNSSTQGHLVPPFNHFPQPDQQPTYHYNSQQSDPYVPLTHYPSQQSNPQYPFPNQAQQYMQPHSQSFQPQGHFPSSPPTNIPPGAHVNPAFFSSNPQYQSPQHWGSERQQGPTQPDHMVHDAAHMPPDPERAFRAAQEKLDVLKSLAKGEGQ